MRNNEDRCLYLLTLHQTPDELVEDFGCADYGYPSTSVRRVSLPQLEGVGLNAPYIWKFPYRNLPGPLVTLLTGCRVLVPEALYFLSDNPKPLARRIEEIEAAVLAGTFASGGELEQALFLYRALIELNNSPEEGYLYLTQTGQDLVHA